MLFQNPKKATLSLKYSFSEGDLHDPKDKADYPDTYNIYAFCHTDCTYEVNSSLDINLEGFSETATGL